MYQIVITVHVLIAITLVALVLIQHGKGATMGASFGAGASQTVFGSVGAASFLMKFTVGLAAAFFATSIMLSSMASKSIKSHTNASLPLPVEAIIKQTDEATTAPETAPGTKQEKTQ